MCQCHAVTRTDQPYSLYFRGWVAMLLGGRQTAEQDRNQQDCSEWGTTIRLSESASAPHHSGQSTLCVREPSKLSRQIIAVFRTMVGESSIRPCNRSEPAGATISSGVLQCMSLDHWSSRPRIESKENSPALRHDTRGSLCTVKQLSSDRQSA